MTREIVDINSVSKVWQSLISERFFPKSRMNIVTKQIKYKISKKTDVSMSSWPSSLWITKSLLAKTYLNFGNVGPNFSNLTPIIFYSFLKINGKKVDETAFKPAVGHRVRGGEWYLEKRGSRKILAGSRNLGSVFDKSRSLVFAWFVFTFFESRNFLPKSLGLGFLTRISASRRVSDFTIRHP